MGSTFVNHNARGMLAGAPPTFKVIVLGPHCWGEAATIAKAKRAAMSACPSWVDRKQVKYVGYSCPPSARVTTLGTIAYRPSEGAPKFIGQV